MRQFRVRLASLACLASRRLTAIARLVRARFPAELLRGTDQSGRRARDLARDRAGRYGSRSRPGPPRVVTRDIGRLQRKRQRSRALDQETGDPGRSHDRRATSNPVVAGGRRLGPPSPCRCAPDGRARHREDSVRCVIGGLAGGQGWPPSRAAWPRGHVASDSGVPASHWQARSPSCRCYHFSAGVAGRQPPALTATMAPFRRHTNP